MNVDRSLFEKTNKTIFYVDGFLLLYMLIVYSIGLSDEEISRDLSLFGFHQFFAMPQLEIINDDMNFNRNLAFAQASVSSSLQQPEVPKGGALVKVSLALLHTHTHTHTHTKIKSLF